MKNNKLKEKTNYYHEKAESLKDYYTTGLQLIAVGELIRGMTVHMANLQRKVDNQAEALRGNQAKIKEMQEEIKEFEIQTGLMRKRTYYNKFVEEVFQKEKGSDLIYPDFDEIYKRYFELLHQREKIVEQLEVEVERARTHGLCITDRRNIMQGLLKAIEIVKSGGSNEV